MGTKPGREANARGAQSPVRVLGGVVGCGGCRRRGEMGRGRGGSEARGGGAHGARGRRARRGVRVGRSGSGDRAGGGAQRRGSGAGARGRGAAQRSSPRGGASKAPHLVCGGTRGLPTRRRITRVTTPGGRRRRPRRRRQRRRKGRRSFGATPNLLARSVSAVARACRRQLLHSARNHASGDGEPERSGPQARACRAVATVRTREGGSGRSPGRTVIHL
mmetsp:Transcript_28667/g.93658  ORF Transcript_28667/g.93658 Transcript_28667/m.93658 type:complete len:219 (+) Transcript_28667:826-1482(+)